MRALLVLLSLLSASAVGASTLMGFETAPDGGPMTDDTYLTDAYSSDGVSVRFFFDGNGITVEVYVAEDVDSFASGTPISGNLYNFPTGYNDETLSFTLPEDKTMDDLNSISVWCVTVGISFGDGVFSAP